MKLEKILDRLNSFEKNSFLKIIDGILSENPANYSKVDKIISEYSGDLKNIDSQNISNVFSLLENEFASFIKTEFVNVTSQLDILIDIIIRDGNCIMKQDWLSRLYEQEIKQIKKKIKQLENDLKEHDSSESRIRDYLIYKACVHTAYYNDEDNNQEPKITADEQSILITLSQQLELSQEEIKLINYMVVPIDKMEVQSVIDQLKNTGIVFYSKKNNMVYVADEMVRVLRKIRGKEVADKFFRRVLKQIREPQINLVCKKHNIDWKQPLDIKIKNIINEGISFSTILSNDIYKDDTKLTEKKKFISELCDKGLSIEPSLKGATVEEKIQNLIDYFDHIEKDTKVGISHEGYEKMLNEINELIPKVNAILKQEFELQEEKVLSSEYLLDYNIKPRDVLEVIPEKELSKFASKQGAKTRGNLISNVLEVFKDSENMYLENYSAFGYRDIKTLKENGIRIKESEIGLKFESLTMKIFQNLGFKVDDSIRKTLNTKKDKIDLVIDLGKNQLIIVECKTNKDSGYNKFSAVKRQLKAYSDLAKSKGYTVIKSLLIGPEFSDDFIKDVGLEYELNLSLITADSLIQIMHGFKKSKLKVFPHNLLMRDVLIQEDRVIKAMGK
ncbi:restriction endonuclease [Fulvivirga lutea]|uniref:Restriction endonuclease n=1 Tax=Fulvivirga lutea TaxID=2810512 RepID=A0A974WFJ7_9BACT|nr:restriction endonuclease [Fulvivirga lutea]QSE97306.1 restriction endonuclease [Fulvivirga lutea]